MGQQLRFQEATTRWQRMHPAVAVFRFVLEILAVAAVGYWGWQQAERIHGLPAAAGGVLLVMTLWGVFRVPGDPGPAPVAIPGWARLLLELLIFGFAAYAMSTTLGIMTGLVFVGCVAVHYIASTRRIKWLVRQNPRRGNR